MKDGPWEVEDEGQLIQMVWKKGTIIVWVDHCFRVPSRIQIESNKTPTRREELERRNLPVSESLGSRRWCCEMSLA